MRQEGTQMSENNTKFYIGGAWVDPVVPKLFDVINPATEEVAGQISMGGKRDVNRAVSAARKAFPNIPHGVASSGLSC